MELRNCKQCGNLFLYNGTQLVCPQCFEKEEKNFELVKDYLWDHPKASLRQVVEGTGVREDKILRYLQEGRISLADDSSISLQCELCGAKISYGRICAQCAKSLGTDGAASKKGKISDSAKAAKLFTEDLLKRNGR